MASARDDAHLAFEVVDGDAQSWFVRRGEVAVHLLASSGAAPRLLAAFPAGNAGAALWFEARSERVALRLAGRPDPLVEGGLRGATVRVVAGVVSLDLDAAGAGSIRALRGARRDPRLAARIAPVVESGPPLVLSRTLAHGRRVVMRLDPEGGARVAVAADARVALRAGRGARELRFRLTALTDEPPLSPLRIDEVLAEGAAFDERARQALAFLCYEEKLLAGSWRFLTYFGRDTLLALKLLFPVLRPAAIEAGLRSVLDRLGPGGEVAHEESVGEWAVFGEPDGEPLDYRMIDDDFLLAPVVARYLLDHPAGRARRDAFLAQRTPGGRTFRAALLDNLAFVVRRAQPFAEAPGPGAMIRLLDGCEAGQWRDSRRGLGGGRIPYDVNAVLVPAALRAAAALYGALGEPRRAEQARRLEAPWRSAGRWFRLHVGTEEARARALAYARELGLDARDVQGALASIEGPVDLSAIALHDDGSPVRVMHTDEGFALLFGHPDEEALAALAGHLRRPFPAGLRTPAGIVIANPVFCADPAERAAFGPDDYHGTVVWSWHHALLAAGLARQLERADLAPRTRALLGEAESALWGVIRGAEPGRARELWSISVEEGKIVPRPYGHPGAADESNPIQLWSTVFLALRDPAQRAHAPLGSARI